VDRRLIAITLAWLVSAGAAAAQNPAPPNPDLPARASDPAHLRGGWYPWDPYQYRDYRRDVPILTGFDVEIERALGRIMSVEILLPEIAWENQLAALSAGTASEPRSRYAYFSKPYRTETDVLILPRGASGRYPFHTIEQMLDTFGKQKFRLGACMPTTASTPSLQTRRTGTRSLPSPAMLRTCEIFWPASSTASSPTALPPPPQPGAGTKEPASKSIRYASPPIFISC